MLLESDSNFLTGIPASNLTSLRSIFTITARESIFEMQMLLPNLNLFHGPKENDQLLGMTKNFPTI